MSREVSNLQDAEGDLSLIPANLAIPGGSELIGMWGGEWDMKRE
jgi:hypothetical protein